MHTPFVPRDENRQATGGSAWTVRVAMSSARHARTLLFAWFVLTIGLFALSQAIGGIRIATLTGSSARTESAQATAAMQRGADAAPSEELNIVITSSTLEATDPAFRATVEQVVARLRLVSATIGSQSVPAVADLSDPYAAPATAGLIAPDLTSVRIVGRLDGDAADLEARARALEPELSSIRADLPAYDVHALGTTLLTDQMADEINRDMDASLWISLPATFLILLVAFGALVAASVPLVLAVSTLLAAFGLFGIFSQVVEPVSPYAGQFIVLIGLAVAVDYSLFVITRFRSERRSGLDRLAAIEVASATSGRAVLFSGIAVMISLAALFLLPDPMFRSIAIGTIAVIAVSVAGSVVFLPAVLALIGDGVNRGRIPFLAGRRRRDFHIWARIVTAVMRRPIAAGLVAVAVLAVLASPVTRLRLGESDIAALPQRMDSVRAVQALQEHWPQGALLGLDVVVSDADEPATQAAIHQLEAALLAVPGLSGPARLTGTPDGTTASVSVLMSGAQNDPANWDIVRRIRSQVVPAVFGSLPGVDVFVGGEAAASLDQTAIFSDSLGPIFAFVLGLSFVLLLLVFRSIAIPIKAILLNLLATGAAFGAMVLVFQDGWLGPQLGIEPTDAIQNFVPIFVFTMLFGLSMDYEVFILARVREAFEHGASTTDAVAHGIGLAAGTVTSAAAIMVVVFGVFLTLPLPIARELGLGLMVAVFVDATIIRTVLLPASMRLLGDWNWWLPGFLGWLPRISIEGVLTHDVAAHDASMVPSGTGASVP